ncbi:MAG: prepilin-type N-terminal cleavage/methylation domain-containing protein [Oceanisphaera sp.]|uniref:prepilin-type N-terminal cleavage/methylation domain-containing protein n=1 Tax=Oceanisphaera sp. TaxID=1929979 RepID=UPI003C7090C7
MNQLIPFIQLGPHNKPSCHHKQSGFTLIELVLVLVLLGILGAVALPRFMVGGQFEDRLQTDKLVGLLRQAQLRAMNDPQAVKIGSEPSRCSKVFINTDGFSIANNCESGLLSKEVINTNASQGYFVGTRDFNNSAYTGPSLTVQFGQQAADADFLSEASLLGQPFIGTEQLKDTLTITIGGKAVHIEPEGYIHGP